MAKEVIVTARGKRIDMTALRSQQTQLPRVKKNTEQVEKSNITPVVQKINAVYPDRQPVTNLEPIVEVETIKKGKKS